MSGGSPLKFSAKARVDGDGDDDGGDGNDDDDDDDDEVVLYRVLHFAMVYKHFHNV